jgi:hypothetical protein
MDQQEPQADSNQGATPPESPPIPDSEAEELIDLHHSKTGKWIIVQALRRDDPNQDDVITKKLAKLLGYSGEETSITPVWYVHENGKANRKDPFRVVESAPYDMIFGPHLSDRIFEVKRQSPFNLLEVCGCHPCGEILLFLSRLSGASVAREP